RRLLPIGKRQHRVCLRGGGLKIVDGFQFSREKIEARCSENERDAKRRSFYEMVRHTGQKLKWATDLHRFSDMTGGVLLSLRFICVHVVRPSIPRETPAI